MDLTQQFGKNELIRLHELIYQAVNSEHERELIDVITGLRDIIDFTYSTLHYIGQCPVSPEDYVFTKAGQKLVMELVDGKRTHLDRSADVPFEWVLLTENYPRELLQYCIERDMFGKDLIGLANLEKFEP